MDEVRYVTVKQLIDKLKEFPEDMRIEGHYDGSYGYGDIDVTIYKDREGNESVAIWVDG